MRATEVVDLIRGAEPRARSPFARVPRTAVLEAETAGVAGMHGDTVAFEVQVWRDPGSRGGRRHHLRVSTSTGYSRTWGYPGRHVERCWAEYGDILAAIAVNAGGTYAVTRTKERGLG
ncbi:MAG: hypothetical protein AB7V62_15925 [Thermoleophilia bacterium]